MEIKTISLFGKEYEIIKMREGYIELKDSPIFIKNDIVYTPRGSVPITYAQTDKIRVKMVKDDIDKVDSSDERKFYENIVDVFGGDKL